MSRSQAMNLAHLALCFALASLPLAAQPRCASVPAGLSAWITFDEPIFRALRVPGHIGSAARFNGKDQFIEMPASIPGPSVGDEDFTIELWFRTRDATHTRSLVDKRSDTPLGYLIYIYNGEAGFQVATRGKIYMVKTATVNIADGHWHHVAGVSRRLPPQPLRIFVDGVHSEIGALSPAPSNIDVPTPLWLGRHHANNLDPRSELYYEGDMDELTFYHRALSPAEILSIFRAGSAGKCH